MSQPSMPFSLGLISEKNKQGDSTKNVSAKNVSAKNVQDESAKNVREFQHLIQDDSEKNVRDDSEKNSGKNVREFQNLVQDDSGKNVRDDSAKNVRDDSEKNVREFQHLIEIITDLRDTIKSLNKRLEAQELLILSLSQKNQASQDKCHVETVHENLIAS